MRDHDASVTDRLHAELAQASARVERVVHEALTAGNDAGGPCVRQASKHVADRVAQGDRARSRGQQPISGELQAGRVRTGACGPTQGEHGMAGKLGGTAHAHGGDVLCGLLDRGCVVGGHTFAAAGLG